MRFKDKVALVTGAASGIGRATAQRLYDEGACVVLVDWNRDALAEAAAQFDAARVWHGALDVAREDEVAACVAQVRERFGEIDALCNIAGIAGGDYSIVAETDTAVWQQILGVNLMGVVHFTKWTSQAMIARGQGAIVNVASVAGVRSGAGGNAYSASKAAVINLTMTSACDLAPWAIRVNAVCPGLIETGMTAPVFDRARELNKTDRLGYRCELRRPGRAAEVAAAIAFLASDDASYITGQALPVDGGNTASLNLPGMKV
ncbi:MAG: glucose 1-dehydrogenase [Paraburkholderia tropica]|uniref:NAD(P)-dependent dehydrogenase (Short-subunit alcohol dehydrogenase family) n=1 Tax=Paraburkholderia tropica TaxID=92647 RepID=A0ABX5MVL7_9BURK|nr:MULTISPECIES: glucose 1-dehydrogenase [Burkholderiaceae]MDE1140093.1 glucose 1-dehydrogenase [Paraburkholderia tropica]PXX18027.1 NAD(P)-dependent dehydrogenase (short-subunit alcohol dehydrogenase family) [Paraburkholderia tropica]PZW86009.1 NAD(P)-dependent dehydrogenase (short-subunit alcohol dehydrogenase family) [Paraburkholderia tropica]QNB16755.1 glucose 1-dehydrogenase [Paraburkholderia tropica]